MIKPENALYFKNNKILPFFTTLVIGDIDVEVDVTDDMSGVSKAEFYVDDELQETDNIAPYSWTWDEMIFGRRIIRAVAYDKSDNNVTDERIVWKFF